MRDDSTSDFQQGNALQESKKLRSSLVGRDQGVFLQAR